MSISSPEHAVVRSPSKCARIKELGYIPGKHVNLYGERMEFVSDPFEDGDCVAVLAFSTTNSTVRTINLPVYILSFWEDLLPTLATLPAPKLTVMASLSRTEGTAPA